MKKRNVTQVSEQDGYLAYDGINGEELERCFIDNDTSLKKITKEMKTEKIKSIQDVIDYMNNHVITCKEGQCLHCADARKCVKVLEEYTNQQNNPYPSDEEIHKEAFKRQRNSTIEGITFEFNMSDFKAGAMWARDNYQPQTKKVNWNEMYIWFIETFGKDYYINYINVFEAFKQKLNL